jgi:ComF family protein
MKKFIENLLDFLLPRSKMVQDIETITAEELRKRTPRSAGNLPSDTLALFDYKSPLIRQAIWELKYRGNKKVARLLAECLYEELVEEIVDRNSFGNFLEPILIPIPLSKARERERGWNQTEILASALLERGGSRNFFEVNRNILVKIKDTESQTKKNRAERLENLQGCFHVRSPEIIAGRNIILLDDVTTTGATFEEARKTLAQAGARKVLSVALAH